MAIDFNITNDITFDSLRPIIDELKGLDRDSTIMLNINSNGGILEAAFELSELLQEFNNTIVFSECCCSAATIIFLSCKVRIVSSDCIFIIHRPSLNIEGDADIHYMAANILDLIENEIIKFYNNFTSIDLFLPYMIENQIIDTETLLKFNFITEVL